MDEILNKKWKWVAAFLLCVSVFISIQLQESGVLKIDVKKIVYSSEDLSFMRNLLREVFGQKKDTTITVSSEPINQELLTFVSVKPFQNGYLLTFEEPLPILAIDQGLVVYTGHSKETGKTISVFYEDDTTVTYGNVDSFSLLPYTSIEKGSTIANKEVGDLYLKIEKNGETLNLEETLKWLKEHTQP